MSTNTTFVPIAVYIPIAIPVSSSLTPSEIQTLMNNSLTEMNSKTFTFELTKLENQKTLINEPTLTPTLSHSISEINEQNFTFIDLMNEHLSSSNAVPQSFETEILNSSQGTEESTEDYLYQTSEIAFNSDQELSSWCIEEKSMERSVTQILPVLDLSKGESTIDTPKSLVCTNSPFSDSLIRQISNSAYFNQSIVQNYQTLGDLSAQLSTATSLFCTTSTKTQTQQQTNQMSNQWCLNWDNPQCCQNNRQCCVFSNESNEIFFPVSTPRSCPPSPSHSSMRSPSLLLLTLCSILLRNLYVSSVLLSLPISLNLQALYYCFFKSSFKASFSDSDQKFSTENRKEREEREEREEGNGKDDKGGKGDIIIDDHAADHAAAYYAAYYYVDYHVVHDVVSSSVAPVASLAIRAIA